MATCSDDWDGSQRCFRTSKLLVEGGGYIIRELIKQNAITATCATLDIFLGNEKPTIDTLKRKRTINDSQYDIMYPPDGSPTDITKWDITLASCVLRNCFKSTLSTQEETAANEIRNLRNTLYGHATTLSMTESEFDTHWEDVSSCLTEASLLLYSVPGPNPIAEMITTIPTESLSPEETIDTLKQWFTWENKVNKKLDEIAEKQTGMSEDVGNVKDDVHDIKDEVHNVKDDIRNVKDNSLHIKDEVHNIKDDVGVIKDEVLNVKDDVRDVQGDFIQLKEAILKKDQQVDQRELHQHIEAARTRIEDHMELVKEINIVGETRSTSVFTEKLKKSNIIILTGIPGSGKTFLAFNILRQILENDSGLYPLIMSVPKEFKKVLDPSQKLVLFVDDMLGKFSVENIDQWNRYVDQFLSFTRTRKLLVIITIRKNIMSTCMHENTGKLFDPDHIYDLDKMQFSAKEKEEMIIRYAERDNIEVNKEELQVAVQQKSCGIGFPFLCTIMKKKDIRKLFSRPVEFIKWELLTMKKKNTESFVALLMTLFCDNKMYKSGLDAQQQRCFDVIKDYFMSSSIDMGKMFDAAEALDKTYLTVNAQYFSFVHDTIAESTFSAASDSILDILIQFCPLEILTRFFGKEQNEESAQTTNGLPYKKIADRFKFEIDKRQTVMQCIGASSLWQDKAFCDIAFQILDALHFYKEDEENKSLLCYLSRFGRGDLIRRVIDSGTSAVPTELLERQVYKGTEESCRFGNADGFDILIAETVQIADDMLFAAIHGGNCDIMTTLLEKGGNIRARKPNTNENLLHEACARKDYESARLILDTCDESTRAELISSTNDVDRKTPLLYAAMKGNAKLVGLLLENGANIDSEDKDGFNSLHCASMYGNYDVVEYICTHHKHMLNKRSTKGYTAAHAATAGDTTCLEYLLKQELNFNDVTHDEGTLLHEASINGNAQVVRHLCEKYGDMVRALDVDGETAGHYAARGGHVDCLSILREHKLDPTGSSHKGYTPLHEAAFCGKLDAVKYLASSFPESIKMQDLNGENAAHHAAAGGHLDCLTYLTERKIDPWNTSKKGLTILHKAAQSGNLNVLKYIVKTYKDMTQLKNENGDSAIVSTVIRGNLDCLKYLLKLGIDPMITNKKNKSSLLHHASFFGRLDMVQYLSETYKRLLYMKNIYGGSAAFVAASGGHLDCLQCLIAAGVDPYETRNKGETLLQEACFHGKTEVVKYLCNTYRNLNKMKYEQDGTAAYSATRRGHLDCLEIVIKYGVDPLLKGKGGETLLHTASSFGHLHILRYLREEHTIPIDSLTYNGCTAAYYASGGGHLDCLTYLIQQKADPWATDTKTRTLLHAAAFRGKSNVVKYLCEKYDTMVKEKDMSGENAAHKAAACGHLTCLKLVIGHNINPMDLNCYNMTVLHLAAQKGNYDIVKYLCDTQPKLVKMYSRGAAQLAKKIKRFDVVHLLID